MSQEQLSGIDFATGMRVNRLFDRDSLVEKVKKDKKNKKFDDLGEVADAYGGFKNIPTYLKPEISSEKIKPLLFNFGGKQIVESSFPIKGVGKDEEVRAIRGLRGTKYEIVPKNAPTAGFPRIFAGLIDAIPGLNTDLDKRGDKKKDTLVDLGDPSMYTIPDAKQSQVSQALEDAGIDVGTSKSPFGNIDEITEAELAYQEKMNPILRQRRRDAAIDAQLQYIATEPIRQAFLNRAAEQAAQRGLRIRGALEAMPSNIQNIMSAKQQQQSLASLSEAERQRATAAQQDAATRFAGLGMQRRFG